MGRSMELLSIKASADLAVEQGNIEGVCETKYGNGITPIRHIKQK